MSALKAKQFHFIDDMDIAALVLGAVERVEALVVKVGNLVSSWSQRTHERRQLTAMSEHMLDDIGVTRGQVDREAGKYFWQQ